MVSPWLLSYSDTGVGTESKVSLILQKSLLARGIQQLKVVTQCESVAKSEKAS